MIARPRCWTQWTSFQEKEVCTKRIVRTSLLNSVRAVDTIYMYLLPPVDASPAKPGLQARIPWKRPVLRQSACTTLNHFKSLLAFWFLSEICLYMSKLGSWGLGSIRKSMSFKDSFHDPIQPPERILLKCSVMTSYEEIFRDPEESDQAWFELGAWPPEASAFTYPLTRAELFPTKQWLKWTETIIKWSLIYHFGHAC